MSKLTVSNIHFQLCAKVQHTLSSQYFFMELRASRLWYLRTSPSPLSTSLHTFFSAARPFPRPAVFSIRSAATPGPESTLSSNPRFKSFFADGTPSASHLPPPRFPWYSLSPLRIFSPRSPLPPAPTFPRSRDIAAKWTDHMDTEIKVFMSSSIYASHRGLPTTARENAGNSCRLQCTSIPCNQPFL